MGRQLDTVLVRVAIGSLGWDGMGAGRGSFGLAWFGTGQLGDVWMGEPCSRMRGIGLSCTMLCRILCCAVLDAVLLCNGEAETTRTIQHSGYISHILALPIPRHHASASPC